VLLALCRPEAGGGDAPVLREACDGVAWSRLVATAHAADLLANAYAGLGSVPAEAVPETARDALRAGYMVAWMHRRRVGEVLRGLLLTLQDAGVEAIVTGDAALAWTVYDDPALRPVGSIEVAVRGRDRRWAELAAQTIASSPRPGVRGNPRAQVWFEAPPIRVHQLETGSPRSDAPQVGRTGAGPAGPVIAIGELSPRSVLDVETTVPSPTAMLLALLGSDSGTVVVDPRLALDVATLVVRRGAAIDWDRVHALGSRTPGPSDRVWAVLTLSGAWFRAPAPWGVLEGALGREVGARTRVLVAWQKRRPFDRTLSRLLQATRSLRGRRTSSVADLRRIHRPGRSATADRAHPAPSAAPR
jgi:hypothetical protein